MEIELLDRQGNELTMTVGELGERLKRMGNPPGEYVFVPNTLDNQMLGGSHAVMILARDEKPDAPPLNYKDPLAEEVRPVWVMLKNNEKIVIKVE